jgi:hypothetical protein
MPRSSTSPPLQTSSEPKGTPASGVQSVAGPPLRRSVGCRRHRRSRRHSARTVKTSGMREGRTYQPSRHRARRHPGRQAWRADRFLFVRGVKSFWGEGGGLAAAVSRVPRRLRGRSSGLKGAAHRAGATACGRPLTPEPRRPWGRKKRAGQSLPPRPAVPPGGAQSLKFSRLTKAMRACLRRGSRRLGPGGAGLVR